MVVTCISADQCGQNTDWIIWPQYYLYNRHEALKYDSVVK